MQKNIICKFQTYLRKIQKLYKVYNVLVAISGGPDSISLIKLLHIYQKLGNISITYIYIDHQWNHNSYIHIKHLINQIKSYGSNLIVYQINCINSSETYTRKIRYQIILNHAINYKYLAILTGHNNSDKIETFIQQMIRGTSINGVTSLTFMNKINKVFFFAH